MLEERPRYCTFCAIGVGGEPATIYYEDDEIIVFKNVLRWVPVMLLVVPKKHYTQAEFWAGPLIAKAGQIALDMGNKYCPEGFRVLANFGWAAMQTQNHGHIHVVGGTFLGPYV